MKLIKVGPLSIPSPKSGSFALFINALALYGSCSLVVYGMACQGTTPAQALSAFDQAIAAGSAAVVPIENLACEAAEDIDPTGATAVCTEIDATGAAIGTVFTTIQTTQAAVNALLKATAPKTAPVVNVLTSGHSAIRAKLVARKTQGK
jgi:hypothetical protein